MQESGINEEVRDREAKFTLVTESLWNHKFGIAGKWPLPLWNENLCPSMPNFECACKPWREC